MFRTALLALCFCLTACSTKLLPGKDSSSAPAVKPPSGDDPLLATLAPVKLMTKANPVIRKALGKLIALGESGCKEPFIKCSSSLAWEEKGVVFSAIQKNGLTLEQAGISRAQLQKLERKAELKIANQKLSALIVRGGANTRQELDWLSDICLVVLHDEGPLPLDGNPLRSELRALAPKDALFVSACSGHD